MVGVSALRLGAVHKDGAVFGSQIGDGTSGVVQYEVQVRLAKRAALSIGYTSRWLLGSTPTEGT